MRSTSLDSPMLQLFAWLASAVVFGFAGLLLIDVMYVESMDCSNPELHESANTTFGWTIAIVASVLPVAIAIWLAGGPWRRLPALAYAAAVFSLVIWWWMLVDNCEWSALSQVW